MSIIPSFAPTAAVTAFSAQLPAFLSGPAGIVNPAFIGEAPYIPNQDEVGTGVLAAVQVFSLSLKDVVNSTGTISPTPAGWQIFAGDNSSPPQVISGLVVQRHSGAWKLASVAYGTLVRQQFDELNALSSLPGLSATEDYETFLLEIPGANLRAFWLVPQKAGSTEFIRPLPSGNAQIIAALKGPAAYPVQNLLATIIPIATANLAMSARYGA